MLHELIPKGTMIPDELNLMKSILPNDYFNQIRTFIQNTQEETCFFFFFFFPENVSTLMKNLNRGGGCS